MVKKDFSSSSNHFKKSISGKKPFNDDYTHKPFKKRFAKIWKRKQLFDYTQEEIDSLSVREYKDLIRLKQIFNSMSNSIKTNKSAVELIKEVRG